MALLSISEITLPDTRFEDDVALLAAHDVGGIGIWEYKIEDSPIGDAVELLQRHGLRATNCIAVGNSVFPYSLSPEPADPSKRVEALRRRIARLAPLHPESLVVITGPPPASLSTGEALDVCTRAFATLARTAADEGVRLALEPMHPSIADELSLFDSVASAGSFLDGLAEPAMGILVDAWHVGDDPKLETALRDNAHRIAGTHLADHRVGGTAWTDRAFPGEGRGESLRLVQLLDAIGFTGALDVEIFSDDGRYGARVAEPLCELPAGDIVERCLRFARSA